MATRGRTGPPRGGDGSDPTAQRGRPDRPVPVPTEVGAEGLETPGGDCGGRHLQGLAEDHKRADAGMLVNKSDCMSVNSAFRPFFFFFFFLKSRGKVKG